MSTSISSSSLVTNLNASYQRLAQAQARVQETRAEVDQNRAQLQRSEVRYDKSKQNYSQELRHSNESNQEDVKYAAQTGTNTQQVTPPNLSAVNTGTPTVNASGQTVGSVISVTA
jgi:hypothetical protein